MTIATIPFPAYFIAEVKRLRRASRQVFLFLPSLSILSFFLSSLPLSPRSSILRGLPLPLSCIVDLHPAFCSKKTFKPVTRFLYGHSTRTRIIGCALARVEALVVITCQSVSARLMRLNHSNTEESFTAEGTQEVQTTQWYEPNRVIWWYGDTSYLRTSYVGRYPHSCSWKSFSKRKCNLSSSLGNP